MFLPGSGFQISVDPDPIKKKSWIWIHFVKTGWIRIRNPDSEGNSQLVREIVTYRDALNLKKDVAFKI